MDNLLSIVTFLPLFGAIVLMFFLRGDDEMALRNAKLLTLFTTLATFAASLVILFRFDAANTGFQMVEDYKWLGGLHYKLGVDGISILFVMLTTFFMPIVIGVSWKVDVRVKEYMVAFLLLEALMIGVFVALDLVLFYVFFEAGLIPMFLIIGIWGGKDRIYAAFKFFLYTLAGSLLMLVAMLYMWYDAGTTDVEALMQHTFASGTIDVLGFSIVGGVQTLLWFAFFASFAVKLPMWPVHTWLPDAHVQAPTAGSVVLAAILIKMGGYGFLRFSLPMFPIASEHLQNFIFFLSVAAIILTSLIALAQTDMKKLIAYSSVAHMGFVTMGIFAFNQQGLDGAIFQMISHGIVAGALFMVVGVIYDRLHTREIAAFGGLSINMPKYALVFMIFTMANVGLPGLSGFVGEILTLTAVFKVNTWVAFGATTGVILSAVYSLWLYRRVMFGDLIKESLKGLNDMDSREKLLFAPLLFLTVLFGVYPALLLDITGPAVEALLSNFHAAIGAVQTAADVATS